MSKTTAIKDNEGNTYIIDSEFDLYFVGEDSYLKTVYLRNGVPSVSDYATRTDTVEQTKWVTLATWLFEAKHQTEVRGGFEVVQKEQGNDFTIENLARVKKRMVAA